MSKRYVLVDVAQKYHKARQFLGKEPMDMTSDNGRKAVNALLTGSVVETMLQMDQQMDEPIANTQLIMGKGTWTKDNLNELIGNTQARRTLDEDQVKTILKTPDSTQGIDIIKRVALELLDASGEMQRNADPQLNREAQMQQQQEQIIEQPMIQQNPFQ